MAAPTQRQKKRKRRQLLIASRPAVVNGDAVAILTLITMRMKAKRIVRILVMMSPRKSVPEVVPPVVGVHLVVSLLATARRRNTARLRMRSPNQNLRTMRSSLTIVRDPRRRL